VIAERQGLIVRNPAKVVSTPKVSTKEMSILDDNQVRQFMITAQESRFAALYYLAVTTGLRQGELLGLKWHDVDWASSHIHVRRQLQRVTGKGMEFTEPKTKAGRRRVELGQEALQRLSEHRRRLDIEASSPEWEDHELVFPSVVGTPLDQRRLHYDFKRVLRAAGLPDIRFHDLRHTAATLMLMNGIPLLVVSRRLGHSKPSVTLDIYGHYLPGMQSTAAALMDELATPIAVKLQQTAARIPKEEV
jgi:integrase